MLFITADDSFSSYFLHLVFTTKNNSRCSTCVCNMLLLSLLIMYLMLTKALDLIIKMKTVIL